MRFAATAAGAANGMERRLAEIRPFRPSGAIRCSICNDSVAPLRPAYHHALMSDGGDDFLRVFSRAHSEEDKEGLDRSGEGSIGANVDRKRQGATRADTKDLKKK